MAIELKVPTVGESITEAVVGEWLKAVGDFVREDEMVVVLETDKVNVDLLAPASGVLTEILQQEGAEVAVGETIGWIEPRQEETTVGEIRESPPEPPTSDVPSESSELADAPLDSSSEPIATPAARRVLAEHGLEATSIPGTGKGGRVLKEDVLRHLEKAFEPDPTAKTTPPPPPSRPAASEMKPPLPAPSSWSSAGREEEMVRMTTLRRRLAERLVQSQQSAALLTTFNDVDMSEVMALRRQHREAFQTRHGTKLGFMSFFVKAVIEGLKAVPELNAELRDDTIVYRNYFDIGVAVGGGKGLVVPVIRNAERLSFAGVEKTLAELAGRARENRLTLDELQGGTFTISNGGIYGSLLSTPIVNPPQSGILGMHRIEERPVVRGGEVVVRPMMYLALTYDHRLVDGREAVTFLVKVKEAIEQPSRILLEV